MKSAVILSVASLAAAAPTLLDPSAFVHELGLDSLTGSAQGSSHEETAQTPGQQGVVGFAALADDLGEQMEQALQGFTITQVPSHKKQRNGPLALASMLQKYNMTISQGLRDACSGPWSGGGGSGGDNPWEHNHPKPSKSHKTVLPEPTEAPEPTYSPEPSYSPQPSETPAPEPSETPEPQPTTSLFTPTPQSSSSSPSPSSVATPSSSSSSFVTPTPSPSSETPTPTPSSSQTPTPTPSSSQTPIPTPSSSATPTPSSVSPSPSSTQSATPSATGGQVDADPEQYDQAYLSPVQIGTPGQTLMLDFDTGSSDLWVFSNQLPASQQSGHSVYDPATSSSSKELTGQTWNIRYGDESGASGNVYADTVVIGGVTATSQAVEAATSISTSFTQDQDNDGLLGLGFGSINQVTPTKQKTWFENVAPTLPEKLFTVTLKRGAPGHYDFGFIDQSRYTGNIDYSPVDSSAGYWQFTPGNAYAGTRSLGSLGPAVADTGSSLILTQNATAAAYYANGVGQYDSSAQGWVVPCTGVNAPTSTLPDFSIDIAGVRHTTPGQYIAYAPITPGQCYGGVQDNRGLDFTILGDVFLKSQFVVFDTNGPRVGFAPQSSAT